MARTRAFRREQYALRKERVKRRYYTRWLPAKWKNDLEWYGRWLGFHARTPKVCSGYCCGNQRKWFGHVTVQEQKAPRADEEW